MIGTITRWGTKGYGFVRSPELATEAWLHAKFLEDPEYQPHQGDTIEFTPDRLPDGRYQARRARFIAAASGVTGPARQKPPARPAYTSEPSSTAGGGFGVKLSLGGIVLPVREPEPVPRLAETPTQRASLEASADRLCEKPPERQEPRPPSVLDETASVAGVLAEQLAVLRRDRDEALARLKREVDETEAQLVRLQVQSRTLRAEVAACELGRVAEEADLAQGYVAEAAAALSRGLEERQHLREAVALARRQSIQRMGLPPVDEYEGVRERLREAAGNNDELAAKAFRSLERVHRGALRELADALDRMEAAAPLEARFVCLVGGTEGVVLVAPVRAEQLEAGAGVPVRVALAFWHAVERAARELGGAEGTVEHGRVFGSIAVRLRALDPALFPLLLDETWASRPTLEALEIQPCVELVEGFVAPWEPEPTVDDPPALPPSAEGRSLTAVASRLGLALHDLVALLHDRGLPFSDDELDAGTEETLRALLGEARAGGAGDGAHEADEEDERAAGVSEGTLGASAIAGRMLRKLLRDRRVGGRHTRIEHAYGHHFSDEEKEVARRVAEWLEKEGIFLPKLNEGSRHISINPRRLRDVGQIIDGTWDRCAALDEIA